MLVEIALYADVLKCTESSIGEIENWALRIVLYMLCNEIHGA
jgi:hypothetical protein